MKDVLGISNDKLLYGCVNRVNHQEKESPGERRIIQWLLGLKEFFEYMPKEKCTDKVRVPYPTKKEMWRVYVEDEQKRVDQHPPDQREAVRALIAWSKSHFFTV
jgi:hypothetical protein